MTASQSGTAGKPILDVLRANEMTDCVVAVTRYFGGILLGSGGLVRAYSSAASLAMKAARAARIMDQMEQEKIIGPYEGAKPRAVLISRQQWLEMQMNQPEE